MKYLLALTLLALAPSAQAGACSNASAANVVLGSGCEVIVSTSGTQTVIPGAGGLLVTYGADLGSATVRAGLTVVGTTTLQGHLTAPDLALTYGLTASTGSFSGSVTVGSMISQGAGQFGGNVYFSPNTVYTSTYTAATGALALAGEATASGINADAGAAGSPLIKFKQAGTTKGYVFYGNSCSALQMSQSAGLNSGINVDASDKVGVGTCSPTEKFDVYNGNINTNYGVKTATMTVTLSESPAAAAACTAGKITWDASYIYVCTASGAWKRAALTGGY